MLTYWTNMLTLTTLTCWVWATVLGNPRAVRVLTANRVLLSSWTVQKPDGLVLGGPNPDKYLSTRRICRDRIDPSVPIYGSGSQVILFMVSFRYPTMNCKRLTLVHHCPFLMYLPPWYSTTRETRSLPHPANESQRSVNEFWSCKSGNTRVIWLLLYIIAVFAAFVGPRENVTLPAQSWKWA